jgi:Family of unknown function (DUF6338)
MPSYGQGMPTTTQAALVFLVIVLPGFLAQGGYRLGRAVPEHPQGLVAVARVIALSTLIDLIAWKLGGHALYTHARAGTALTTQEADTYWFAVGLFALPAVLGYVLGQAVDFFARGVGARIDHLPAPPDPEAAKGAFGSNSSTLEPIPSATSDPCSEKHGPSSHDRTEGGAKSSRHTGANSGRRTQASTRSG